MQHPPGLGAALVRVYLPGLGGGGQQHLPSHRPGLPQLGPGIANRGAAAGALGAEQAIDIGRISGGEPGGELVQFHLQLLGDQHGQTGHDALPHLGAGDLDHNAAVAMDAQPGIGSEAGGFGCGRLRCLQPGNRLQIQPQHQSTAGKGAGLQEAAPA